MDPNDLRHILDQVRTGQLDIESALDRLAALPVAELDFAHVDLHRHDRCGFPEVIFAQGKTCEWLGQVVAKLLEAGQDCLATRVSDEQAEFLVKAYPAGQQNRLARTFWLPAAPPAPPPPTGKVIVITAGTADLPVAEEAVVTARALGAEATLLVDVGVAGIHRLLRHRTRFADADAIVVVAGMDGALPSVVGGLVSCPVVAVPTSVGYGAALGGVAPLLTMLNSCAANVVVVNIDSGFKGGYVAALIARRKVANRS
jgi:hypothetical protein